MHTISLWASRHRWPARIFIIIGFVLLTELAFFTGSLLQLLQVTLPFYFFYAAVALFLAVFLFYPDKKGSRWFPHFYACQKACDGVLLVSTFALLIFTSNRPEAVLQITMPPAVAAVPTPAAGIKPLEKASSIQPVKLSKKAFRHGVVKKIKLWRKVYKDTSNTGKAALVVLAIVVGGALLFLLAALSCNLACSGSGGLALLVGLLGGALVVFFLVRVVQRIMDGPRKKKIAPAQGT